MGTCRTHADKAEKTSWKELVRWYVDANEFYIEVSGVNDDTPEGSLHTESGEEESYVPSPKVSLVTYVPPWLHPRLHYPH
jgi:hypothetical protein